ncbi:MAG TPA: transglutaminase domain-containing protein [Pirellulales bacterium]|nr:transglutaminase domain-containing protein [Pirellulales bacterium]
MSNLNRLTFLLATLAALTVGAADSGAAPRGVPLAEAALAVAVALAIRWRIDAGWPFPGQTVPARYVVALTFFSFLPWVVEPARAWLTGERHPFEWLLLLGLRNLALALAALAHLPICLRLAGLASFFVVLSAASIGEGRALLLPAAAYLFASGAWLLQLNWQGRGTAAVARPAPSRMVVAVALLSLAGVAGIPFVPAHTLTVARGFMPSSGGDRDRDPAARSGVKDGDDIVAAKDDAQSVGMTDSDLFLDSPDPSLYDTLSEAYGEPIIRKQIDIAIAVGQKDVRENDGRAARNQKAGREFATVRGRRPPPRAMANLESEAMLYVEGKVPLHLRLATYDRFDGITWNAADESDLPDRMDKVGDGPWMRLRNLDVPYLTASNHHTIKVARFATESIPTPPHLDRFRLEQVNSADFFRWSRGDVLRTVRKRLPDGTSVQTRSGALDPDALQPIHLAYAEPAPGADAIRSLAERWTSGLSRGWPQIEAVAARLKQDYVLDPDYTAPADCPDTASHFLFEARRGPDFQFASAAAALLRSLEYDTRIVTGFYVRPDRFDWRARNTPVVQEDVHAWAEVRLLGGVWTTVEPTPGYELPAPPWKLRKALLALLVAALDWCGRHSLMLAAATALTVVTMHQRLRIADVLSTLAWRWTGRRRWDDRVLATLRLLDGRSGRARLPRPAGQTPRRWYGGLAGRIAPELAEDLQRVLCWADFATYAPATMHQSLPGSEEVRCTCARLAKGWSLDRVRAATSVGLAGLANSAAPVPRKTERNLA